MNIRGCLDMFPRHMIIAVSLGARKMHGGKRIGEKFLVRYDATPFSLFNTGGDTQNDWTTFINVERRRLSA